MATVLKGVNTVVAIRKLSEAKTKKAYIIPFQKDSDLNFTKDTDSETTKSGTVNSSKGLKNEFTFTVDDSDDEILDVLLDSALNDTTLEFWRIKLDKKNEKGEFYADYCWGDISKDEGSSDSEKAGERKFEVNVHDGMRQGFTTLNRDIKDELSYVFRGTDVFDESTNGGGEAYDVSKSATPQPKQTVSK